MSYAPGDFLLQMKQAYILGMEGKAVEEEDEEIRGRVGLFTQRLREMSDEEMRKFLQRVNPKDKLEDTHQCWHDITTGERLNYLYNLVKEFPLDTKALHWETAKSRQTPSTLGNDMGVDKVSKRIYENQANLDFPWIYDWIVGHVDEHVDNIEEAAHIINKTRVSIQKLNNRLKDFLFFLRRPALTPNIFCQSHDTAGLGTVELLIFDRVNHITHGFFAYTYLIIKSLVAGASVAQIRIHFFQLL